MKNKQPHKKLVESILKLTNLINQQESIPRSFNTTKMLYPSEIHTIEAIGIDRNLNITDLSKKLGVKKPSISEIIKKLEKKGMVSKFKTENNKKEVLLSLTEDGESAYWAHANYHKEMYEKIVSRLDRITPEILEELNLTIEEVNNCIERNLTR